MKNHQSRFFLRGTGLLPLHLLLLCLLMVLLAAANRASAQLSDSAAGRRVMVDYIVHFAYHLQWPIEVFSGTDAPFRICLMGGDSLLAPLAERLERQRINGRRAILESVDHNKLTRIRSCQIVILGRMERTSLVEVLRALEFFPVLTVSDAERFAATGGMVEFTSRGNDVSLRLNKTMLDRAELKMGKSLFRLGRKAD